MKKLFALVAVALTLCGLLTACGSKTETANDVDLTGFYNALAEQYGWGDDMMDLDGEMLEMYYPGLGDIAAKQLLAKKGVTVGAHVAALAGIRDDRINPLGETAETLRSMGEETLPVLNPDVRETMAQAVTAAQKEKDSVGGLIECMAIGLPVGLGEPYFDSVESRLSHALFSVPAVKGIAFGDGFGLAEMRGSESNDPMQYRDDRVVCTTNHNGGVTGGITNGMPLVFTLVIKPTPSIGKTQHTVNVVTREDTTLEVTGRHDPCILPRAIPVVEAVTAWTLLDLFYMAERG